MKKFSEQNFELFLELNFSINFSINFRNSFRIKFQWKVFNFCSFFFKKKVYQPTKYPILITRCNLPLYPKNSSSHPFIPYSLVFPSQPANNCVIKNNPIFWAISSMHTKFPAKWKISHERKKLNGKRHIKVRDFPLCDERDVWGWSNFDAII